MQFEWDDANRAHIARHRISPDEAEHVLLNDPLDLDIQSVDGEERFTQVGETSTRRILLIVATLRDDLVRVITGWDAPAALKQEYLRSRTEQWHRPS